MNYKKMYYINKSLRLLQKGGALVKKASLFSFILLPILAFTQQTGVRWTTNPFDDKVFIENKGQFDNDVKSGEKVLYQVTFGKIQAYFTPTGVIYKYIEPKKTRRGKSNKKQDPDANVNEKPIIHYVSENWQNTNSEVSILAGEEQSYYCTYTVNDSGTVKTNAFKKLTYKNLYPGIDAEYVFPKDSAGIKYSLIIHPGADISAVKLKFSGIKKLYVDGNGNVIANSPMGDFTDHAPTSYYSKGKNIAVSFSVNGMEESFIAAKHDATKGMTIDPWVTNPAFATTPNRAYDVDYDDNGNVYAYGGGGPYQLVKMNAAGTIQWKYTAIPLWHPPSYTYYGDFTVDKHT
ncbi:MAG TPA: hypothetical protein VK890_05040, partial [Bacteroidia bacterium]|nr:hypothetical protein [Bacteroidia bacterium]